jgi:hypothetical protein
MNAFVKDELPTDELQASDAAEPIFCSRRSEKRLRPWAATCALLLNSPTVRQSSGLIYPKAISLANLLGDMRAHKPKGDGRAAIRNHIRIHAMSRLQKREAKAAVLRAANRAQLSGPSKVGSGYVHERPCQ